MRAEERGCGAWMEEQCTPYINIVPITRSPGGYRSWRTTMATTTGLPTAVAAVNLGRCTNSAELPGLRSQGFPLRTRAMKKRRTRPHETPDTSCNNLRLPRRIRSSRALRYLSASVPMLRRSCSFRGFCWRTVKFTVFRISRYCTIF